jgi:MFS family permease
VSTEEVAPAEARWLNRGVVGIGGASLLGDLGYEVPTALLPSFLTSTLGAPAAALGLIEGIADGLGGAARLAGGALADDPRSRRATAIGGYTATAVLSALIGAAGAAWQVGVLRSGAWISRGLRGPARNALLAEMVPPAAYGRAYGFERALDNLGAIGGPLLALALVAAFDVRVAILVSVVPGLFATFSMLAAIRAAPHTEPRPRAPLRVKVRPVLRGRLRRVLVGISAFELGNAAATLLILRATDLLEPRHGHHVAVELALVLYTAFNVGASTASVPGGHAVDRRGALAVFGAGALLFLGADAGFAFTGASLAALAVLFVLAGVAKAFAETAENAVVAAYAPEEIRGSAFGILAGIQSFGNLAASAVAGALWTLVAPEAAFLYLAAWMLLALAALAWNRADATRAPG